MAMGEFVVEKGAVWTYEYVVAYLTSVGNGHMRLYVTILANCYTFADVTETTYPGLVANSRVVTHNDIIPHRNTLSKPDTLANDHTLAEFRLLLHYAPLF
jgi:hypothetical protein